MGQGVSGSRREARGGSGRDQGRKRVETGEEASGGREASEWRQGKKRVEVEDDVGGGRRGI